MTCQACANSAQNADKLDINVRIASSLRGFRGHATIEYDSSGPEDKEYQAVKGQLAGSQIEHSRSVKLSSLNAGQSSDGVITALGCICNVLLRYVR